jgi:sugar phosphate permease
VPLLVGSHRQRRPTIFFGWWVVLAGFVLMVLNGGLLFHGFGAYFVHLQTGFRWSRTLLAGAFSMMQLESALAGPVQGWLIDRVGARTIARAGLVLMAAGFGLFSFMDSAPAFYAAFFVIGLGSTLVGWVTVNVAVANWFRRRRATAMGLMSSGQAVGGLLVPALAGSLAIFGWRSTAMASAALFLLVGLPITQLMRRTPEEYGLLPDGDPPSQAPAGTATSDATPVTSIPGRQDEPDFTAREALRSPAFWLISLGHGFALLVVSAVSVHLIPHLVSQRGLSIQSAGAMLAFMTVLTLLGHVSGGLVADRMEKRWIAALAMVGHCLGMLILAFTTSPLWVPVFAVLHGLSWGIRGPLMSAIRADYFGRRAFGTIMGLSTPIVMMGTMTGPLLAGFLADRTGDYQSGFAVLAVLTGLGTCFFVLGRKPDLPRRLTPPGRTASTSQC